MQAKNHYIKYGIKENRKYNFNELPIDFNWKTYLELNNDLINYNEIQIKSHYINHGIKEGRIYKNKIKEYIKELIKEKIILITQYYIIKNDDEKYNKIRQNEINFCLQKNFDNKYIDEIHMLMEEDYNIDFIKNKNNIKIIKQIIGKRLNFKDVFKYYNNNIQNDICILINSDIYLDQSIEIVKNINFTNEKLFISLNRYENNTDNVPALLNGLEINNADYKGCQSFLKPYQESIWSQDAWIWKNKIDEIDDNFNFNLGVIGCDNYINYLMQKLGYKILNCSKIISTNHYDRLSIVKNEFGISKGNISEAKKNRISSIEKYLFLKNQHDIPDKYTTKIEEKINTVNKTIKISQLQFKKNISEIDIKNFQVSASSQLNNLCNPSNVLFNNNSYWEPERTDKTPYIQFKFDNLFEIVVIDIEGKELSKDDLNYGYVSKFKISYAGLNNTWINDDTIYDGIEINNGNYIKKIYLNNSITCHTVKIFPIEYVNIKALKIRFYKFNYIQQNIFNFLCDNPIYFEKLNLYNSTIVDYKYINQNINYNDKDKYTYDKNVLQQPIKEGICLFTYVMNRNNNIYNNIAGWLKQKIDQLIILDWNSNENMIDYIKSLNDDRILYVRVVNEEFFIRTFAQNLAASLCKYNKICKIDSDIVISEHFFENHELNEGEFYVGEWRCGRNKNEEYLHGNTYLFLSDYFRINGYNEFIKDYGWDDSDFTIRLLSCGLTKKIFDYDYIYHTPHGEEMRTTNLITPKNSLLMVFVNQECLKNIIWSNKYKMQQYQIFSVNDNLIICDRIKNNEYSIDEKIYEEALIKQTKILKSWKIL